MRQYYYYDYFKNNGGINFDLLDSLKFELDQHIYYYGSQFKYPIENNNYSVEIYLKQSIKKIIVFIKSFVFTKKKNIHGNIISNAYFNLNHELTNIGFSVYAPPWSVWKEKNMLFEYNIWNSCQNIQKTFSYHNFNEIINRDFLHNLDKIREDLKNFYIKNKIKALIVPNDLSFFENLSVKIFNEMNINTFVFLHGLPSRYNNIDDNRAKYLVVWGNKIKDNYILAGVNADKIIVTGHPSYKNFLPKKKGFSLNNILIITKSMPWAQLNSNKTIISDRGNLVLYLFLIQNVLQKFRVKKVRFRPHPSEKKDWYFKFIDKEFFELDSCDLKSSLEKSSLVIGPTSSVFLESIYMGLNYIVFEPSHNGIDIINSPLVPPFDGNDNRIPVAKNEVELSNLIENQAKVDFSVFEEYIKTPFDISLIKDIIL